VLARADGNRVKTLLHYVNVAIGTKRTFLARRSMSALRGKADTDSSRSPPWRWCSQPPALPSHFGNSSSKCDASQSYLSPRLGIAH
jgi:hypothetical protein